MPAHHPLGQEQREYLRSLYGNTTYHERTPIVWGTAVVAGVTATSAA